jgi:hypothetical protein
MSWWSSAQSIPEYTSMHSSVLSWNGSCCSRRPEAARGHARSLMEGLRGTASDQPFVTPAARRPRSLPGAGWHPALVRGCSCRWLRPRPPIPAPAALSTQIRRRVADALSTAGPEPGPESCAKGQAPSASHGFSAPAADARSCRSAPGHPPRPERGRHESDLQIRRPIPYVRIVRQNPYLQVKIRQMSRL